MVPNRGLDLRLEHCQDTGYFLTPASTPHPGPCRCFRDSQGAAALGKPDLISKPGAKRPQSQAKSGTILRG